jgi:hypothetical protein
MLVDIEEEQTWQKKGRSRTKTTQFNDSPELRQALEDALVRRGVRAVILDEAQHLMKVGRGSSAGKLLDQLDWIKSMTNVTGVLPRSRACERIAIEALEGERKLGHSQSRREHLWHLLQTGMDSPSVPMALPTTGGNSELVEEQQPSASVETQSSLPKKTTRKTTKNSRVSLQGRDLTTNIRKEKNRIGVLGNDRHSEILLSNERSLSSTNVLRKSL